VEPADERVEPAGPLAGIGHGHHLEGFHGFFPLPQRGGAVSNELIDGLREDEPE
jgi:hypothetical protein